MNTVKIQSKTRWMAALLAVVMLALTLPFGVIGTLTAEAAAPATYTNISAGGTASVSITSSGGAKYFRFVPPMSGSYTFWSTNYSGDPYGALLNSSGTSLVSDDDDGDRNFRFTYTCTAGTVYYIKAYMYSNYTGSYTLNVSTPPATAILAGGTATVSISTAGSSKYYSFTPAVSGSYTFWSTGSYDTRAALLNASGSSLTSDDDSGDGNNFRMTYSCTAGTTYYIKAYMCSSSTTGSYTLNVSAAPTPGGTIETVDGVTSYTLFNSGATSSTGHNYSSSSNPGPGTANNGGYDIYATTSYTNMRTVRLGRSIKIKHAVTERATLSIRAFDVDESSGERDLIYLVDETTGTRTQLDTYLSGRDWEWNTTTIYINPSLFTVGHTYHFELYDSVSGWVVYVREVNLYLPTIPIPTEPAEYEFTATGNSSGRIDTNLYIKSNASSLPLTLEYSAKISGDQRASAFSSMTATSSGTTKTQSFNLETGSPDGVYLVEVTVKKSDGSVLVTYTDTVTVGGAFAVSYQPNGGSNNCPIDTTAYRSGNTVTVRFDYTPSKADHTFLGWARSSTATTPEFTASGTKTFTITGNVTLYAVFRPNHVHTESGWIVDTEATCTTPGSRHIECTGCGETLRTETIPALAHNLSGWIVDREATCTTAGQIHKECTRCGEILQTDSIPAPGHTWGPDATCEDPKSCTVCGAERDPALGHLPGAEADCLNPQICTRCNEELAPALGHLPGAEADCLNPQVCTRPDCGDVLAPALGHAQSAWIVDEEASCTEVGSKHRECERCGEILVTAYIPATGHRHVAAVVSYATCTTPGVIAHTCACGDTYNTFVYAEHSYSETEYRAATCTVDGYQRYDCDTCDAFYTVTIPGSHSYEAAVTRVATPTETGEITYTCASCGDFYTVETPMRPDANVLLVQDRLPWTESVNTAILARLQANGYIDGWDMTTTSAFASQDLSQYSIIFIANDQTTATYNQLASFDAAITAFANAGGVVIYGACDHGWAGGNISFALPGGVTKGNYYSYRNYIANPTHNVVTGVLTDGKALTNELLYSTYSSHTYFLNLPENATAILTDANGRPTLVEYPLGDGFIIASGLTWEYTYVRDFVAGTSFAKSVYDDVLVHATQLSNPCDHIYDDGTVVAPTCTADGYTLHTCGECGLTMRDAFVPATGHTPGEWTVITPATRETEGLRTVSCTVCGTELSRETIARIDAPSVRVEAADRIVAFDREITFSVVLSDSDPLKAIAITPIFDPDIFDFVSASFTSDALLTDIEEGTYRSVAAWGEPQDLNGIVYTFTLRAKAVCEKTSVSCEFLTQDAVGKSEVLVFAETVSVIPCRHESVSYAEVNGVYHAEYCDACGYGVLLAHEYDGLCDTTCNDCGHVREVTHDYAAEFVGAYEGHWHECVRCGARTAAEAHVYDGICDPACNDCAYERIGYEIILSIGDYGNVKAGSVAFVLDPDLAEILAAEWMLSGLMMNEFDPATNRGVFLFSEETAVSGAILKLTVCTESPEALEEALATVLSTVILENAAGDRTVVELTPSSITTVTRVFRHDFSAENTDGRYLISAATCTAPAYYYHSCAVCGETGTEPFAYGEPLPHTYDDVCDADCNVCGGERVAPHSFVGAFCIDDDCHWQICEHCGVESLHESHIYDGDLDMICNTCDYARYLIGDVDNDGDKDSDDVIYLLYHVMFDVYFGTSDYPVYQPIDFDGNGSVTSDDASHLLYHIFFGDADYPLHSIR